MPKIEIFTLKQDVFLYINDYLWMWDTEQEREEQREIAEQAYGSVLVAGLGLGVVHRYLKENPRVTSIFTVEKEIGLLEKVEEHYGEKRLGGGAYCVHDFYTYNPNLRSIKWNCIIGDIWPDLTPRCLPDYIRFKEHAETLLQPNGRILAWVGDFFEYLIEKAREKWLLTGTPE